MRCCSYFSLVQGTSRLFEVEGGNDSLSSSSMQRHTRKQACTTMHPTSCSALQHRWHQLLPIARHRRHSMQACVCRSEAGAQHFEPPFQAAGMSLQPQPSSSECSSVPVSNDGSCVIEMPPLQELVRHSQSGIPLAHSCPGVHGLGGAPSQPPPRRATVANAGQLHQTARLPLVKQLQQVSLEQLDPVHKLAKSGHEQSEKPGLLSSRAHSQQHGRAILPLRSDSSAQLCAQASSATQKKSWSGLAAYITRRSTHDGCSNEQMMVRHSRFLVRSIDRIVCSSC